MAKLRPYCAAGPMLRTSYEVNTLTSPLGKQYWPHFRDDKTEVKRSNLLVGLGGSHPALCEAKAGGSHGGQEFETILVNEVKPRLY